MNQKLTLKKIVRNCFLLLGVLFMHTFSNAQNCNFNNHIINLDQWNYVGESGTFLNICGSDYTSTVHSTYQDNDLDHVNFIDPIGNTGETVTELTITFNIAACDYDESTHPDYVDQVDVNYPIELNGTIIGYFDPIEVRCATNQCQPENFRTVTYPIDLSNIPYNFGGSNTIDLNFYEFGTANGQIHICVGSLVLNITSAMTLLPGTACNDGNANTINDIILADGCTCQGTFDACAANGGDSDGDGFCNNNDCQPFNPNIPANPGSSCNDNNANTTNDIILADGCTCQGTFDACAANGGDSDGDGFCNNNDCQPFNPNIPANPGSSCNDGNANTTNDIILADGCTCQGTFDACAANGGDSDGDGFCNNNDCQPFNPNIPANPGSSCNDNNANTTNDIILADGCTCQGTPSGPTPDCSDISITAASNSIIVGGLDGAPITSIQIFDMGWQGVFSCFADCDSPTQTIPATAGQYIVYVKYYSADYSLICEENTTLSVIGGGSCDNVNNGGTISGNQTICSGETAATLTGTAPSGGSGDIEYLWLSSTSSCPTSLNQQISGANADTYNPGSLSQTTYFVRCSRRAGCTSWFTGESNCVTVTIDSTPNCGGGGGGTGDCADITIGSANGSIVLSGLDGAPVTSIQIFTSDWSQTILNCFGDCDSPTQTVSTPNGEYIVYVKYYSAAYSLICEQSATVSVGGGGCTDNDNDGVCAADDCNDNNPSVPAAVGSSCNDGNGNTINDVILADGCTCLGTPNGGGGNGVDINLDIIGDGAQVAPYNNFSVDVIVTNEGNSTSNNVVVSIPQPANVVFQGGNPSSATQGNYNPYSTFNWNVGSLAPGQTETLTLNYFSLAGAPYSVYGQVQSASGTDSDSTPGNGTNPNPNEDDEDVYVTGGGGGGNNSCDLSLNASVSGITCNNNGTPNNANDDTFTFNVTVTGGNPWGWTGGGTSGDMGQAVSFGPYQISAGNVNFTITDNDNASCTTTVDVSPPSACSNGGGGNDCDDITISTGNGTITVGGLDGAPVTSVQIFTSDWSQTLLNCFGDCDSPTQTISGLNGSYIVYVKYYTADYAFICQKEETVTVGGGGPTGNLSLNCGNNVTVNTTPGANAATVTYSTPIANTTCTAGGLNLQRISGPASGSSFSVGTTTVTYQATDNCGNTETCSFTVTVIGTNANLNINCGNNTTVYAAPGANSATVTYFAPTAITTCNGGVNVTRTSGPASGSSFSVGTTIVTYQATDNCGNVETCSFTVTVIGSSSNVTISCPNNITVDTAPGANSATVNYGNANANTNCAQGGLNVSVTQGPASGASFNVGTTTVKYTATDACGSMAMCTFVVTVNATVETCISEELISWNLAACEAAFSSSDPYDFSEFTPSSTSNSVLSATTVYKNNPGSNNKHSCALTPITDGIGMCTSFYTGCDFANNSDRALRFSVTVNASNSSPYTLENLQFYEQSNPLAFFYTNNKYALKYGLRVTVNGSEVFKVINLSTSLDWSLENIDFSDDSDFTITETTTFDFMLLAYCPVGSGGPSNIWEIDDISINGCISTNFNGDADERNEEEMAEDIEEKSSFSIYPNPATSLVNVSLKEANNSATTIKVYDQLGRLVERAEVDATYDSIYRINTADYNAGLYLISVQAGDSAPITKQLVVLRY